MRSTAASVCVTVLWLCPLATSRLATTSSAVLRGLAPPSRTDRLRLPKARKNDVDEPRTLCTRCVRPRPVCICEALPPAALPTETKVLVLQNPVEAKKKVATVPLIPLSITDCTIVRGICFSEELPELRSAVDDGYLPLLLYPGDDAQPLEAWAGTGAGEAAHNGKKALLILVDGTWRQAHHMLRHSPGLAAACQRVCFSSATTSDFDRLRREPAQHCISTVEACARALRLLEPTESAAVYMEESLRQMVAAQLRHVGSDGGAPRFVDRKTRTANRAKFRSGAKPPKS